MAKMTARVALFALLAIPANAQGLKTSRPRPQKNDVSLPSPSDCSEALGNARTLIRNFETAFGNLESSRSLAAIGDYRLSSVYSLALRSTAATAHHLTDRLMACSVLEHNRKSKEKASPAANFSTSALALDDITEFGNMYNWDTPEDQSFPSALAVAAPACKPVIASRLPEKIEKAFGATGSVPSESEVSSLANEANPAPNVGLTICAAQAYKAGYVGAAWRLLSDQSQLSTAMLVLSTKENLSLEKAFGSAANGTIQIQRGPNYCTGTVVNWGSEKTIDWNCF